MYLDFINRIDQKKHARIDVLNPCIRQLIVIFLLICLTIAPIYSPTNVEACAICVPYPTQTLADRLMRQSGIIFARELVDTPYVFRSVKTIKGTGSTPQISLFCDSFTRRKLKNIPDSVVLLTKEEGSDKWEFLTFADKPYQAFIQAIIYASSNWTGKSTGSTERVDFFTKYLTSEHLNIRKQAYLEVGKAPYPMLRTIAESVPRKQIYAFLRDFMYIEWHSLYILFLGQSKLAKDQKYIREKVESAVRLGISTNLSAWLTAFIETNPETGINEIEAWYFKQPGRTKVELEQVLTSFSVIGSQQPNFTYFSPQLRTKIINSFAMLLQNYPEQASSVAGQLTSWRVQRYIEELAEIKESGVIVDPSDIHLLNYYLSLARRYPKMISGKPAH